MKEIGFWTPLPAARDAILLRSKPLEGPPIVLRRVRAGGGTDAQHQAVLEGGNDARTGMP